MVIKINKKIEVIKIEETLKLPENLQNQIEDFWKKQVEENPHLFFGHIIYKTIFLMQKYCIKNKNMIYFK